MNKNKFYIAVMFLIIFIGIISVYIYKYNSKNIKIENDSKLKITTSIYPLYFIATKIGGDMASVKNIIPSGVEPHDFEPTINDIKLMNESSVILLIGNGFENWGEKLKDTLISNNVNILTLTDDISLSTVLIDGRSVNDPHIWLDPVLLKSISQKVLNTFIDLDSKNKSYYENNFNKLNLDLDKLDANYLSKLKNCETNKFITSHSAFGYLAKRYNLIQIPIMGISPDEEPTPKDLAQIVDTIKKEKLKYIFTESFVSPKVAQTIALETGANLLVLDPIEGITKDDEQMGKDYFTIQIDNLKNLSIALNCDD